MQKPSKKPDKGLDMSVQVTKIAQNCRPFPVNVRKGEPTERKGIEGGSKRRKRREFAASARIDFRPFS